MTDSIFSKADLKKLIIPLILEQTLALTVGMIDTIMVASVGESAVSGVSLVDTINILIFNLFAALATGGAIIAGQYLGREDRKNSNHAAKQLIIATILLSAFITILCLAFNGPLLSALFGNMEADVMGHARTYFYVTALSFPFIAISNAAAALFRGMGNSKIPMFNALIMNVLNIIGNSVLIYVFRMGVLGAALSTLVSRIVAAIAIMVLLRNQDLAISVRSYKITDIDFGMIKLILKIGIPNGLENSMFQIGKILLASLVVIFGTSAIAANAVSFSIAMIEIIPGAALGLAITTVVAQCVGAGAYDQANAYLKYLMKITYFFMIILNVVILIFLKPILGIYQLSAETFDAAFQIMVLHSICAMLIWPLSFTLPSAFRAAGDVKFPMAISILSIWVFRIGLAYLFAYQFNLGVFGVWIAMVIDWAFRSLCFVWRWLSGRWKKNILG